jgi:hypothetical protein
VLRPFLGFVYFLDGKAAPAFFDDNSQITTTIQNGFAALAILVRDGIIVSLIASLQFWADEEEDISPLDRLVS